MEADKIVCAVCLRPLQVSAATVEALKENPKLAREVRCDDCSGMVRSGRVRVA